MIRVVNLRFGGLSTAKGMIFRSAGMRTGRGRPVRIFFANENRMRSPSGSQFKKKYEPDGGCHPVCIFKKM